MLYIEKKDEIRFPLERKLPTSSFPETRSVVSIESGPNQGGQKLGAGQLIELYSSTGSVNIV